MATRARKLANLLGHSGGLAVDGSHTDVVTQDANNYTRITAAEGSAQLGLYRSGADAGGFYVGGDSNKFRIYDSALTERMAVDSSGRVTTPYQPTFDVAYNSSNYATQNPVIFDQVYTNIGGHYSTTTGRFTAPVAGLYLFYTSFIKNSTTSVCRRRFDKNGSEVHGGRHLRLTETSANTYGDNGTFSHVIQCAAGDYITVNHYAGNSYGTATYDYFGGYLLG